MNDVVGTTAFTYNSAGDLLTEDGPFNNDTITYSYHPEVPHLRTNLALAQPSGTWSQTYSYDSAKRLSAVVSPAGTFSYTYSTGWDRPLGVPTLEEISALQRQFGLHHQSLRYFRPVVEAESLRAVAEAALAGKRNELQRVKESLNRVLELYLSQAIDRETYTEQQLNSTGRNDREKTIFVELKTTIHFGSNHSEIS